MKRKNKTKRIRTRTITMAAVLSALGVAFLYIGSIFDFLDLTAAAASSLIIVLAVMEGGGGIPWMIYAATSFIAALILPNKYPVLLYIFFAGLYPMVKSAAEKLPRIASAAVKLVFFNAVFTLIMLMGRYLLHLPEDEIGLDTAIYVLGNLMLVAYDYLLTQLITLYQRKLRKMLRLGGMFG